MKVRVDSNCVGCGACTSICPRIFEMGDDGYAKVVVEQIPVEDEDNTVDAAECCPVAAIIIDK